MSFVATLNKSSMVYDEIDLVASRAVIVPGLSVAIIPHGGLTVVSEANSIAMLVRTPEVFLSRSLIVDSGPVLDGEEIKTAVFNISERKVRIAKGQVISRLVSLVKG